MSSANNSRVTSFGGDDDRWLLNSALDRDRVDSVEISGLFDDSGELRSRHTAESFGANPGSRMVSLSMPAPITPMPEVAHVDIGVSGVLPDTVKKTLESSQKNMNAAIASFSAEKPQRRNPRGRSMRSKQLSLSSPPSKKSAQIDRRRANSDNPFRTPDRQRDGQSAGDTSPKGTSPTTLLNNTLQVTGSSGSTGRNSTDTVGDLPVLKEVGFAKVGHDGETDLLWESLGAKLTLHDIMQVIL